MAEILFTSRIQRYRKYKGGQTRCKRRLGKGILKKRNKQNNKTEKTKVGIKTDLLFCPHHRLRKIRSMLQYRMTS